MRLVRGRLAAVSVRASFVAGLWVGITLGLVIGSILGALLAWTAGTILGWQRDLAFTLGVVPLAIAKGASAASQNAIGIAVLGGMISATVLAVFFVPAFFVFVIRVFSRGGAKGGEVTAASGPSPAPGE